MQKRTAKQLAIGGVYLSVAGFIVSFILLSQYHVPTCSDGIQNQGEEGTDCGGPCSLCEWQTIKDVDVLWIKFFEVQQNTYDAAVLIDNPNPSFGLEEIDYTFSFFDSSGNILVKQKGRTFVLPNQKKYIIESRVNTFEQVGRVEFEFGQKDWQKLEEYSGSGLFVRDRYFESNVQSLGISRAGGIIKNTSPYDWNQIVISVVLFSQNKEPIAVGKTEAFSFLSGEERDFVVTWFKDLGQVVFDTEMLVETNVFADGNFMEAHREAEKFQEL